MIKETHEKRLCTLCQIVDIENWLSKKAKDGHILKCINETNYVFEKEQPTHCRFLLMNSEPGNNSESWLFFECEQKGGERISCRGRSFFAPELALKIDENMIDSQKDIVEYYYKYRNYRLAHRLLNNCFISLIFFLAFLLLVSVSECDFMALVGMLLSTFLLPYFVICFIHFLKSCSGFCDFQILKKPHRPGYEHR